MSTVAKTELARMTWPEAAEAAKRGAVAMLPLASIEPSGRHSVMGGEIHIVEHVCEHVAKRTGAFRLPTVPFGYASTFMGFPGAITLRPQTLVDVIVDSATSLIRHGFEHVLIVNNHSGNEAVVEQAARQVREQTGVVLGKVLLPPIMRRAAEDLYQDLSSLHGHGGEPGVSVRLYLTPDDMRLDLAEPTTTRDLQGLPIAGTTVKGARGPWTLFVDYHETNLHGGTGDASGPDPEKGKLVLDRLVDFGVEVVEAFAKVDTRIPVTSAPRH